MQLTRKELIAIAVLAALAVLVVGGVPTSRADTLPLTHQKAEKLYYNSHGKDYVTDRLGVGNPAGGTLYADPDNGCFYLHQTDGAGTRVTREDRLPELWFPFQDVDWDGDGVDDGLRAYDETGVVLTADFSRFTAGTYLGPDGLIHTAAIDEPRYGYYSNMTGLVYGGLLLESASTNYAEYSESFGNWSNSNVNVTADCVDAPVYGNMTSADTLRATDAAGFVSYSTSATVNAYYCFSVYLRAETASVGGYISLGKATDGFTNYSTPLMIGWQRFDVSAELLTSDEGVECRIYNGQTGTDVYAFGAQLEAGNFPTSYIPTSGSTVTRGEDSLTFPKPSGFDSAGAIVMDYSPLYGTDGSLAGNIHIVQEVATQATNTQSILYHYNVADPQVIRTRDTSGELTANLSEFARETPMKLALTWGGTRELFRNDTSLANGSFSGSFANKYDLIRLMKNNYGFVRNLIIFDRPDMEVDRW